MSRTRYFELLVRVINKYGGDVFKFAGDAMLILWPMEDGDDLSSTARRAAQCSLAIQARAGARAGAHTGHAFTWPPLIAQAELHDAKLTPKVKLSIKIGIGAGDTKIMHVGGVFRRLEYLCSGDSVIQAFGCEGECLAGMAIVSPQTWALISNDFSGKPLPSGRVMLQRVLHPLRVRSLARSVLPAKGGARDLLQSYVPAAIIPHLKFHTHSWASELRALTVMFLNLGFKGSQLIVRGTRARARECVCRARCVT